MEMSGSGFLSLLTFVPAFMAEKDWRGFYEKDHEIYMYMEDYNEII